MVAQAVETRDITLYPTQFDFVADEHRLVAFVAGRNSGKTVAGSWKAVHLAEQLGGLGIIAAPDFPMLEFGAKRAFMERLRDLRIPYETQQQRGVVGIPRWKAEVRFATLENESRVRGPNYAWGWVDELDFLADRAVWQALKGAVRDGPQPQLFATSTPKGRRLIWEDWIENATDNHALYRATTFDNPFIDAADYVQGLGYAGRFYDQEITAEFVGYEGLVYPAFDRDRHVREVDTTGWPVILGVDAGVRNPSAIATIRYSGDARHQEREFYQRGLGSDALRAAVKAEADRCGRLLTSIEIDPSAAGLIVDLGQDGYPVNKANNAVSDGIREVTSALNDGMTIDPSCIHTIAEYESYSYPDGTRTETDNPVKQNDHLLDAIRYVCQALAAPKANVFVY